MDIHGTPDQQIIYLNTHWGSRYQFKVPSGRGGQWTATDKFGDHDELQAPSAAELLNAVRRHYQANYPLREQGS
jgi:hypothetical protein